MLLFKKDSINSKVTEKMEDRVPTLVVIPALEREDSIGEDTNSGISFSTSSWYTELKRRRATATTAELWDFAAGGESYTVSSKEVSSAHKSVIPFIILQSNGFQYNDETREPCIDYTSQQGRGKYYYKDDDFSFSTISTKDTYFYNYFEISFDESEEKEQEGKEEILDVESDDLPFLSQKTPVPEVYSPPLLDYFMESNNNGDDYYTEGFVNVGRLPGVY